MENIIGHGCHEYRVINDWGNLNPAKFPVDDCHEMVRDKNNRLFLLTNETRNNILIYNENGDVMGNWGNSYPGAHGLSISDHDEEEFLLITDIVIHQVIKTTLNGKELMVIDYPKEISQYTSSELFNPTETAIAANGDIYVVDGYGLQFVIQYNSEGKYIRHWGGFGQKDWEFDCVHGIAVDNRTSPVTLLITSRNQNCFKRFTMDGNYIDTINLPGSFVCRPVIKGDFLYAAVFRSGSNLNFGSGYILILDNEDKVVSAPGASAPMYINGELKIQHQESKDFMHPHDVSIDDKGNIIVCQWKSNKSYPIKLEKI